MRDTQSEFNRKGAYSDEKDKKNTSRDVDTGLNLHVSNSCSCG